MSTLDYYNNNAAEYASKTVSADMSYAYKAFLPLLPKDGKILDLGCGSGRDSRHFLDLGYDVIAVDGSEKLCEEARKNLGIDARCLTFDKLDYDSEFDGVWANASLLHVKKSEMKSVLKHICCALKTDGVLYLSYKYGDGERMSDGRHYSDYTERDMAELFEKTGLEKIRCFVTGDSLGREDKWLNVLARKQ